MLTITPILVSTPWLTAAPLSLHSAALQLHYAQLEALAFNEEFDRDAVEDFTLPPTQIMKKVSRFTPPLSGSKLMFGFAACRKPDCGVERGGGSR